VGSAKMHVVTPGSLSHKAGPIRARLVIDGLFLHFLVVSDHCVIKEHEDRI
jgi:hypothetical protein